MQKKKNKNLEQKKIVFVGMSGGVDSSVSAALLKQATPNNFSKFFGRPTPKGFRGYNVIGVFIRTWHPEFIKCNEEEERRDAMRVAAHMNIPFLTFDFEDVYKKKVADYMISEYKAGRTPNPDVMCNKEVKFGAFFKKALSMGALVRPSAEIFVATGHYAQNVSNKLVKAKDPSKDQVYFLWTLKQEQLSKILFPIGHLNKTEVRKLAKKFKLPVAEKKDSQGICFLGAVDLKDFLKHYIKEKKGEVILVPSDLSRAESRGVEGEKPEVIGFHNGVFFNTLGERHGFTVTRKNPNDGAYYVIGKDIKKNILYVSQDKNLNINLSNFRLYLKDVNWINQIPKENKTYTAQIRYHGELLPCKIKITGKTKAEVAFKKPILVAPGQSCVIYDKNICLGGGVVI